MRTIYRKNIFILSCMLYAITGFSQSQKPGSESFLLIGTYTSAKSEGIYTYRFNSETGEADSIAMIKTPNPSYLDVSKKGFVYAVHEIASGGKGGEIAAFSFDMSNGRLKFINQQNSGGDHPCYVAVDKTGKWVVAANYSSGSLALLPVNKSGGLEPTTIVIQHEGYSVDSDRQKGPHTHCGIFSKDNKYVYAADLGIDKLMIYSFNEKSGKLTEKSVVMTEPGAGPRHFTFDPKGKYGYLIEELTGTISSYRFNKGLLELIQNISALPPEYSGPAGSADIHVSADGKFLYASNRGESNTIAIFGMDRNGILHPIDHQSTLGKTPRNFSFDPTGNFLLVGNQNSDQVVIFKVDKQTGLLSDTGKRINVGKPVCLKWILIDKR